MNNKKEIIMIYIFIILEIIILLKSKIIIKEVYETSILFIKTIFPSLFPNMIISSILSSLDLSIIIPKKISKKTNTIVFFILSAICGSPANILIINNMINKDIIDIDNAKKLIKCSLFINPLFIISMSYYIFDNIYIGIITILIILMLNILKFKYLNIKINNKKSNNNNNLNAIITNSVSKSINSCLLIFGLIIVFNILSTLLFNIFNFNQIFECLLKGLLEVTTGLASIKQLSIPLTYKYILFILFIKFGGLCIRMQINSIISISTKKIL